MIVTLYTHYSISRSDCPSHTNNRAVSELMRVTMVVTVQIIAPADLSNPYGATYGTWKQLAEKAVSAVALLFSGYLSRLYLTDCSQQRYFYTVQRFPTVWSSNGKPKKSVKPEESCRTNWLNWHLCHFTRSNVYVYVTCCTSLPGDCMLSVHSFTRD